MRCEFGHQQLRDASEHSHRRAAASFNRSATIVEPRGHIVARDSKLDSALRTEAGEPDRGNAESSERACREIGRSVDMIGAQRLDELELELVRVSIMQSDQPAKCVPTRSNDTRTTRLLASLGINGIGRLRELSEIGSVADEAPSDRGMEAFGLRKFLHLESFDRKFYESVDDVSSAHRDRKMKEFDPLRPIGHEGVERLTIRRHDRSRDPEGDRTLARTDDERRGFDLEVGLEQRSCSLCQRELSPIPGAGRPGVGV